MVAMAAVSVISMTRIAIGEWASTASSVPFAAVSSACRRRARELEALLHVVVDELPGLLDDLLHG